MEHKRGQRTSTHQAKQKMGELMQKKVSKTNQQREQHNKTAKRS